MDDGNKVSISNYVRYSFIIREIAIDEAFRMLLL